MELLIVDDHVHLVEEMEQMIPWKDLGIEAVHCAYSGAQAMNMMSEHTIHIVITDIRMPGMSGIELIEQITGRYHHVRCIVLSGYDEFEYAKTAIQFGVKEYLLKPLDDEELMATVRKVVDEIRCEWEEIASKQKAAYAFRSNLPHLRAKTLLELLQGRSWSEAAFDRLLEQYELPFRADEEVILFLLRMDPSVTKYSEEDQLLFEFAVCNIAEETVSDELKCWYGKDQYGFVIFLAGQRNDPQSAEYPPFGKSKIDQYAESIVSSVDQYLKQTVSVYVSSRGKLLRDAAELYRHSLVNMMKHFANEPSFVFTETGNRKVDTFAISEFRELYTAPTIQQLLEIGHWEEAESRIEMLLTESNENQTKPEHILEAYLHIVSAIVQLSHKNHFSITEVLEERFHHMLDRKLTGSAHHLLEWSLEAIRRLREKLAKERQHSKNQVIRQVQQFIEEKLSEDLSLKTIAEQVYLHPAYLSRVYKTETGEGISDYIQRRKMDQAAHRLKHTNDKVYDIAYSLGYQNANYFAKMFKKQFGVTPLDYRNT